ncbi:MAG: MFS transporter [Gaiellaceae bacterium]
MERGIGDVLGQRPAADAPAAKGGLGRVNLLFAIIGVAESSLLPFAPLLLHQRGFTDGEIGGAFAIMSLLGFAAGPAWAYVADRHIGSERALAFACFLSALASVGVLLFRGVAATFVTMSLLWAVRSPNFALTDAIALDWLEAGRRSLYGRIRLWSSAGWAAGALLWGGVLQLAGLELMNVLYPVMMVTVGVYALVALRRERPLLLPHERPTLRGLTLLMPALALFLLSLFLVNAAFSGALTFATIRIQALGGGAFLVGLAGCLQAATEVPVMGATPRLSRRMRPGTIFGIGCVIYIGVFLTWALVPDAIAVALVRLVAGVGFALIYVASVVIVDELVPPHLRATGQAASKAVTGGVAPVLGSLGGGLVYGQLGPRTLFVVAAGFSALAALAPRAAESRSSRRR